MKNNKLIIAAAGSGKTTFLVNKAFGESKGATMDRVLIYPTKTIKEWIKDNRSPLKNEVREKFYVGLTRARLSSTIVMDYQEGDGFDGVSLFTYVPIHHF